MQTPLIYFDRLSVTIDGSSSSVSIISAFYISARERQTVFVACPHNTIYNISQIHEIENKWIYYMQQTITTQVYLAVNTIGQISEL